MAFCNSEALARRRAARRLHGFLKELGLLGNLRYVAKATGIDMDALRNLHRSTPKVETLEKIGRFVEDEARKRRKGN